MNKYDIIRHMKGTYAAIDRFIPEKKKGEIVILQNNLPVYIQVEMYLKQQIQSGTWPAHYKLPDEIRLAKELDVSRGTLRKAIRMLVEQGFLRQIRGKGTYVQDKRISQPLASRLISFSEAMRELSMDFRTVVLAVESIAPDQQVAAFLQLEPQERVMRLERVRLVDNRPVIYLHNYVPEGLFPGILDHDYETETLFDVIEKSYHMPIDFGRRYFKAVAANSLTSFNLGLPIGHPIMLLEQITYSRGHRAIEYSHVWINTDRFEIVSALNRK